VKLTPKILDNSQKFIQSNYKTSPKPVNFVFHGGSGSSREEIREAISYGVIKMNMIQIRNGLSGMAYATMRNKIMVICRARSEILKERINQQKEI